MSETVVKVRYKKIALVGDDDDVVTMETQIDGDDEQMKPMVLNK